MAMTRRDEQLHHQADQLTRLARDLHSDEKLFILKHWNAAATNRHRTTGAWFTPLSLARDLSIGLGDSTNTVIDLCAGIGHLTWECRDLAGRLWNNQDPRRVICVEREEEYVRVGRKILPDAHWICANAFTVITDPTSYGIIDRVDVAISNPPYGRADINGTGPRYTGKRAEYHVLDAAAELAQRAVFLIPQDSAPFAYSGRQNYVEKRSDEYERFVRETGLVLKPNCGIDTHTHDDGWHYPAPRTEVVLADLQPARQEAHQPELALTAQ
ncbi:hypothetical protein MOQ72_34100 [Saccharopolyspora sp. K220]|uniref:hypothetical protein n=1 Tax=Saccharopolyspora soli TaxID=2926618 RepID=UPI001F5AF798|nr:hypothetical protein [Saccharopolyspora soli]MCI2422472.1 hypothetical protein [Saccharopolyspora soli]